jgi:DNA helicase II / ATP-dependent DNA helicase PcrA
MGLNHWDSIRERARKLHAEVCSFGDTELAAGAPASALLDKAEEMTKIQRVPLPKGHPLLEEAEAMLDWDIIWYNKDVAPWLALYYQAHEYAHFWLHDIVTACSGADVDAEASEDNIPLGIYRVEGYGPHERRECEANVFAREFLLPSIVLRRWFIEERMNAEDIAARTGMSVDMVSHQLARALLTPDIPSSAGEHEAEVPSDLILDESQRNAARAQRGPLLIEAGPGTGKTRTLIGRILYLLERGEAPDSILALTFSNKAAEEMRERIAVAAPTEARQIWMGTFHAFGLELLRKYGTRIGLTSQPDVIDPVDALFLLEQSLPQLELDYYQNLYEPTTYLRDILNAISRAKDELVGPARYTEMAQTMYASAATAEERETAEKALEVAHVYAFYQDYLDREKLLDFGDLIFRSVNLLRDHPEVRDIVRQMYRQVLVDEYQDVNRASGLLLREIAGRGRGLWAVGDIRQAIYRWRGASPVNMRLFERDFPGATVLRLKKNYRSRPAVVAAFSELAPRMRATSGVVFRPWQVDRADATGSVLFEIADNASAEAKGIAREIERRRAEGMSYRDQAVICRSHTSLARIAASLEKENIPVLYLGDLFERPEVRDLLSLLALACEGAGRGLIRVARFPEYRIPLSDVIALRVLAQNQGVPFPQALELAEDDETISPEGKQKLALLAQHIEGLCHGRSAWKMLVRYLFGTSSYLRTILTDDSVVGQQRRLAVYQFLKFAHEQLERSREAGVDPKLSLLRYVRRLEIYGEERQLRQVPAWADGIDAVRILTIHASKGLEFGAVYLPVLGGRYFPASRQPQPCPPPVGLIADGIADWHEEEEECLFFVALSRARDHLCLSRAQVYGRSSSKASKLLSLISSSLSHAVDGPVTWPDTETFSNISSSSPDYVAGKKSGKLPIYPVQRLDVYMKCPRRYFYEFVLELGGKREESAYIQFHQCVYDVLHWVQYERSHGRIVDNAAALAYLAEIWRARGPLDHAYEPIYRSQAEMMVRRAVARQPLPNASASRPEYEIALPHGRVKLTIDNTELVEGGPEPFLLVQRIRTGRPTKSESEKPIYGLYQAAAEQAHPAAKRRMEILYLSTNEAKDFALTKKQLDKRLADYDEAILGILREQFSPEPSDRECPRCPHYFICPMAEDG